MTDCNDLNNSDTNRPQLAITLVLIQSRKKELHYKIKNKQRINIYTMIQNKREMDLHNTMIEYNTSRERIEEELLVSRNLFKCVLKEEEAKQRQGDGMGAS